MMTESDPPRRVRQGTPAEWAIRWLPLAVVLASVIASFAALKAEAGETQRRIDRLEAIQVQVGELRGDMRALTAAINARAEADERARLEVERRLGILEQAERERRRVGGR